MAKTIVLDFDGVIHSYTSPWLEADFIPDPPVPGALGFIKAVLENPEYKLAIFSSRNHQPGGIRAMCLWLKFWFIKEYGWEIGAALGNQFAKHSNILGEDHVYYWEYFPRVKPSAWLQIDDRAFTFNGMFPTFEEIDGFKPWNKK